MTPITLESIKEKQAEILAMIAQLENAAKAPSFFDYQGERIALKHGEIYVGTITTPGEYGSYHLVLLPGEAESVSWKDALKWAEAQGGELPNRVEGALLFATQKPEFDDAWYWTREAYAPNSAYAWYQNFSSGSQNNLHKGGLMRARAVRRLEIEK